MFDLPEITTLARQIDETLTGKIVTEGRLGNRPHRFVWYNREPDEFRDLTCARTVGRAHGEGKWLFLPLEPGYVLVLGDFGGRLLYHAPDEAAPDEYHLLLRFSDGSALSEMTQMWGAMELYRQGEERERPYIKDMRTTPDAGGFTSAYFEALVAEAADGKGRSVKGLLVQDQLIPGLGNAIAQDIMWRARLHPRRPMGRLTGDEGHALYDAIRSTVAEATAAGGRSDEVDLFGHPGGYQRVMDRAAVGTPCRRCGTAIEKLQYLGGACYLCPSCQV
jgi:formamidopyrimidine-DNA glycosylase